MFKKDIIDSRPILHLSYSLTLLYLSSLCEDTPLDSYTKSRDLRKMDQWKGDWETDLAFRDTPEVIST